MTPLKTREPGNVARQRGALPLPLGLLMLLLAQALLLSLMARWSDLSAPGEPVIFALLGVAAGIVYGFATWRFERASFLSTRQALLVVWSGAVAFRLLMLPAEPGDDVWRYLWEGTIQLHGHSPYNFSPDDPVFATLREELPYHWRIGHPAWSAIYPPLTQLVLAGAAAISNTVLLQKLLYLSADLLTLWLVGRLVPGEGSSEPKKRLTLMALYGWNPLIIYSFAGAAHFDSLMLAPLVGAAVLLRKYQASADAKARDRLAAGMGLLLGLAISFKMMPLALLPVFALALRENRRFLWLLLAGAVPFYFATFYGYPAVPVFDKLREFALVARTNDLFWWISERLFWENPRQLNGFYNKLALLTAVAVALIWRRDPARGLLWATGALLILSPVLHPWYITWILPWAAWVRNRFWLAFSVSGFFYFLLWQNTPLNEAWEVGNFWIWSLQVLPAAAFAWAAGSWRKEQSAES